MDQNKRNGEFDNNVYKNFMDFYFNPEINRRRESKLLTEEFILTAAQVLFFPDGRTPIIRLNEEVAAEVKLKKGVDQTKEKFWPTIEDVEDIRLYEKDFLNCGHATLVLLIDGYQLSFDFQYNRSICTKHVNAAEQFLTVSKFALENDKLNAFVDLSFSAVELLAKVSLMLGAHQGIVANANHKMIKSAFNIRQKNFIDDIETKRREVFNFLFNSRDKARYLNGDLQLSIEEAENVFEVVNKMYQEIVNRIGSINPS